MSLYGGVHHTSFLPWSHRASCPKTVEEEIQCLGVKNTRVIRSATSSLAELHLGDDWPLFVTFWSSLRQQGHTEVVVVV